MKETVTGALIAALIGFVTGFIALFQMEGVTSWRDIAEASWWVLAGGAVLSFLKDYQALATRRMIGKMRGNAMIWAALVLPLIMLPGCVSRPTVDSVQDAIAVTAADITALAGTVQGLCGNTVANGACRADAVITTATKDRLKAHLQRGVDAVSLAKRMLVEGDMASAQDQLALANSILTFLQKEVRRYGRTAGTEAAGYRTGDYRHPAIAWG